MYGTMHVGQCYVANNPVNANDPTGMICVPCVTGLIGAGAGAVGSTAGQILSNRGLSDFNYKEVVVATGVGFAAGAAAPFTATSLVGAALTGGTANVAQLGINGVVNNNLDEISTSDVLLAGVTGVAGGSIGGSVSRHAGLRFSETSKFLDPKLARRLNTQSDLKVATAAGSLGRNIFGAAVSNVELDDSIIKNLQSNNNSQSANGGFVLYPNRPNTNMINAVYKK